MSRWGLFVALLNSLPWRPLFQLLAIGSVYPIARISKTWPLDVGNQLNMEELKDARRTCHIFGNLGLMIILSQLQFITQRPSPSLGKISKIIEDLHSFRSGDIMRFILRIQIPKIQWHALKIVSSSGLQLTLSLKRLEPSGSWHFERLRRGTYTLEHGFNK